MKSHSVAMRVVLVGAVAAGLYGATCWVGARWNPYTPAEWIRHAEHRLQGHPKLEWLLGPVLAQARHMAHVGEASGDFQVPPAPFAGAWRAPSPTTLQAEAPRIWLKHEQSRRVVGSLSEAARLAHDGDVVELAPGDHHAEAAVWRGKGVTIEGQGGLARLHADGVAAEGKALLVLGGGRFVLRNLAFIGVRVPDRNGAGVRFEGGELKVEHCLFWGSDSGILTGNEATPTSSLEVKGSEFGYLGNGDGYSHAIYAGRIARLAVTGSYFHHGNIGHLIKSRAQTSLVHHNRLTDEAGGRASYELDFPNGGRVEVWGNVIEQSATTANSAMVSMGEEGGAWQVNTLSLLNNTLVNDAVGGGRFLVVRVPLDVAVVAHNALVGDGVWSTGRDWLVANNARVDVDDLARPDGHDYRIVHEASRYRLEDAGLRPAERWAATQMYVHPLKALQREAPVTLIGAQAGGSTP